MELKSGDIHAYGESVAGRHPNYSAETVDTAQYIMEKYLIKHLLEEETNPYIFMDSFKWIRGHNMAKAAIEMALWDLHAKKQNKPLYQVIGGVRNYAEVGVSIGIQKDIDTLINKIGGYLDQGYGRIKIKVKPGWDVNVLDRVRTEYPDIKLTVDANAAFNLEKHLNILREMDKYRLLYIEQPLKYDDLVGHSILQSNLETDICLDESLKDSHKAWEAISIMAGRVFNIKPGRVGGIIESRKIHDIGMKHGVPVWIGGMLETGIGRSFLVTLATLPNVKYPSDISASSRYYEKDIITEPFELQNGSRLYAREDAGIGVEPDWPYLKKIAIKEKTFS